jgi:hypothetical protein
MIPALTVLAIILIILLIRETVTIAGLLIWLCVQLVAFCVLSVITAMLAVILGCQKLSQVFDEWQWRRRYGEILPPD